MQRFRSRRPSPALVVSIIALVAAMGGSAYAGAQLANNSVATKHLKQNAVTSGKVKNRTLKVEDLAPGVLTAGPQGAPGAPGAQGERGEKGDPGAPPCELLLCPGTDVDGEVALTVRPSGSSGSGSPLGPVSAFTMDCEGAHPNPCTFALAGRPNRNIEFDSWFEESRTNPNFPLQDLSITINDESGDPIRRFHATGVRPTEMTHVTGRFQVKFTADFIQRVSV